MPFNYVEAFCLMLYRCEQCNAIEVLWNSRDGVTPYTISCRYCNNGRASHWEFHLDRAIVDFKPHDGMRIFINLTKKKSLYYTKKKVDKLWNLEDYALSARFSTKEKAIEALNDYDIDEGEPDVVTVGETINGNLLAFIKQLKTGDCWCGKGVDNPMLSEHTTVCNNIQLFMKKKKG